MGAEFPSPGAAGGSEQVLVPFGRVGEMVRHLTHDFRNGLNSMDLQSAYLAELVTEPETAEEVKRLRTMITSTAKLLQSFAAKFWIPQPQSVTYSAQILLEDFRNRLAVAFPDDAPQVAWTEDLGDAALSVDIEMFFTALTEFFRNAFQFREGTQPIAAHASTEHGQFHLDLREAKSALPSPPQTWGRVPLVSSRRDGFGLGLFHALQLLALLRGEVTFEHDAAPAILRTRISLPLAA